MLVGPSLGTSVAHSVRGRDFSALAAVPIELDSIVRSGEADTGAVTGEVRLDEAFTLDALRDASVAGTHFGDQDQSALQAKVAQLRD